MASTPPARRTTPSRTPRDRASTAEPPSSHRSIHTPLGRATSRDLLNSVRRATSASGGAGGARAAGNAPTPHAKLARRALLDRRTAVLTPGKNRRQSLRDQRETPMDILRNLGRKLAATSKPVSSSSSSSEATPDQATRQRERDQRAGRTPIREGTLFNDDEDDEEDLPAPRLSLPIDQDDDDDDLRPPRPSGLEEMDYTVNSVELPRRMDFDREANRLSRGSLGSVRPSDIFNVAGQEDHTGRPSDFFPAGDDNTRQAAAGDFMEYERIDTDPTRRETLGRISDFGLEMPEGLDGQTTFMMSEPGDAAATSPMGDIPAVDEDPGDETAPELEEPEPPSPEPEEPEPQPEDPPTLDQEDPDPEPFGDFSDRQSIEDLSDPSDEEGVQVEPRSGRGPDIVETAAAEAPVRSRPQKTTRDALPPRKKRKLVSRHGIEYPSLPPAFVKRVAQRALQSSGLSNPRVSTDTLSALTQASEWFFEQLGDDLGAYANHAKRKTIEESDVMTLMRRQRQISSSSTMFSLAERHLPRELLQELRMPLPESAKRRGRRQRDDDDDEDEEDE